MGGPENISNLTHCVTRLRFALKDKSKADTDACGNLDGVLKVVESGGQTQVVIGPAVKSVFDEAIQPMPTEAKGGEVPADDVVQEKGLKALFKNGLDTLIACFVPTIPVMAGCGMIKVLVVLLQTVGIFGAESTTASVLNIMGDAVFYFLPFFVAFNAARKMNVDIFLSMIIAAIILHPDLSALGEAGTTIPFLQIPMRLVEYSGQALPVIFGVWLLKYVDKFADKYSPDLLKIFLRPMIDILVVGSVTLLVLGPISGILGDGFMAFCTLMNTWGWIAVGINAALFPIMVLTGTHNATIPLLVQMFATQGFDSKSIHVFSYSVVHVHHPSPPANTAPGPPRLTQPVSMKNHHMISKSYFTISFMSEMTISAYTRVIGINHLNYIPVLNQKSVFPVPAAVKL